MPPSLSRSSASLSSISILPSLTISICPRSWISFLPWSHSLFLPLHRFLLSHRYDSLLLNHRCFLSFLCRNLISSVSLWLPRQLPFQFFFSRNSHWISESHSLFYLLVISFVNHHRSRPHLHFIFWSSYRISTFLVCGSSEPSTYRIFPIFVVTPPPRLSCLHKTSPFATDVK